MKLLRIEAPQGRLVLELSLPEDTKDWHYYLDDSIRMEIAHISITDTESEDCNEAKKR